MSRRKVINGKVYDVDTAKPVSLKGRTCLCRRIIKYENNSSSTSYISLYRKKTGEYFTAKYSPNDRSDILLTVDNVLNRQDITSHTSSDYYSTPRNFLLSYRYKF